MMQLSPSLLRRLSLLCAVTAVCSLSLHWPDAIALLAASISYLLFCTSYWLPWRRHRLREQEVNNLPTNSNAVLIAYASQTGNAHDLAEKTAAHLAQSGQLTRCLSLNQLDLPVLQASSTVLLIVSTTGEGDAPDNADRFCRQVLSAAPDLSHLRFAVLALGDRHYTHYCAFGHRLAHWFAHHRAHSLFDLTEVDNGDAAALRHWQHCLGVFSGHTGLADWNRPAYQAWTLESRTLLNPGSLGAPVFHLRLKAPVNEENECSWQAGDIAEIGPLADGITPASDLPHREYSIASLPEDGTLELLVRQHRLPDGRLGLGSGWLTAQAGIGQTLALRVRSNPQFRPPAVPALVLIGNGTGLAGLRSHLKQRIAGGEYRNWLLFGERQAHCDFFFGDELCVYQQAGWLELDACFSRDQAERRYVQHLLAERAEKLQSWVAQGAAILVCGSLQGMAGEVHDCLLGLLGEDLLDRMSDEGRYLRDVY